MKFRKAKEFIKEDIIDKVAFHVKRKKATPVLVYQMGKVGSSSIYHPLKKVYTGIVAHTHQFNQNAWYWNVRKLHELYYNRGQTSFKIISLIREPIGRNVSEFFHRSLEYAKTDFKDPNIDVAEVMRLFLNNLDHDFPLDWFDNNFKKHFDIDVYEKPFPKRGYDFFEKENVQILLLKHDLSDNLKEQLINQFLGIDNFKVQVRNVGDQKVYKAAYKKFKAEASMPESYLTKMLTSKYFQHFYNHDNAQKVRAVWDKEHSLR